MIIGCDNVFEHEINELENLYLKEYYDYNFTAFYDEIKKK